MNAFVRDRIQRYDSNTVIIIRTVDCEFAWFDERIIIRD